MDFNSIPSVTKQPNEIRSIELTIPISSNSGEPNAPLYKKGTILATPQDLFELFKEKIEYHIICFFTINGSYVCWFTSSTVFCVAEVFYP